MGRPLTIIVDRWSRTGESDIERASESVIDDATTFSRIVRQLTLSSDEICTAIQRHS